MGSDTDTTTVPTTTSADGRDEDCCGGGSGGPSVGDTVYALGFIGALVWFWRRADGVGGHALAVGKAAVWPAILVYRAFKVLDR